MAHSSSLPQVAPGKNLVSKGGPLSCFAPLDVVGFFVLCPHTRRGKVNSRGLYPSPLLVSITQGSWFQDFRPKLCPGFSF